MLTILQASLQFKVWVPISTTHGSRGKVLLRNMWSPSLYLDLILTRDAEELHRTRKPTMRPSQAMLLEPQIIRLWRSCGFVISCRGSCPMRVSQPIAMSRTGGKMLKQIFENADSNSLTFFISTGQARKSVFWFFRRFLNLLIHNAGSSTTVDTHWA